MRLTLPIIAAVFLVSGCVQSSGIMTLAPDTYSLVTADELGGAIGAKQAGLKEATVFCQANGLQMVTMQSKSNVRRDWVGDPVAHHDLTFRCVESSTSIRPVMNGNDNTLIVQ